MRTLRILVVEDDLNACHAFQNYADTLEDVELVGASNTAADALHKIKDNLPHAVILDLELHNGGGSGIEVLQGVMDMAPERKPFFLITTVNTSNMIYEQARKKGADYIMYKFQEGYSEKYALDFLRDMSETIQSGTGRVQTTETPHEREKRIHDRIVAEFYRVGISTSMKGYDYLVEGVKIYAGGQTQKLTEVIARKFGKSKASVERAMQNAIDKAWKETDVEELVLNFKAHVNSDRGVPTVLEFVSYYAKLINREYGEE